MVDLDIAAVVGTDVRSFEPRPVGVGLATHGHQHMAAGDAFVAAAGGTDDDAIARGC